jgi:hypothetical protein
MTRIKSIEYVESLFFPLCLWANNFTTIEKSKSMDESAADPANKTDEVKLSAQCEVPTIKGNLSSSGEKIYHVPGGAFYDCTVAEQMFCSAEEAQAVGFRASSR